MRWEPNWLRGPRKRKPKEAYIFKLTAAEGSGCLISDTLEEPYKVHLKTACLAAKRKTHGPKVMTTLHFWAANA